MKKIDSSNGPQESTSIKQINDYSDFALIDKLDKSTYITDEFKNYTPTDQDMFI